jgi:hypothetical protein
MTYIIVYKKKEKASSFYSLMVEPRIVNTFSKRSIRFRGVINNYNEY